MFNSNYYFRADEKILKSSSISLPLLIYVICEVIFICDCRLSLPIYLIISFQQKYQQLLLIYSKSNLADPLNHVLMYKIQQIIQRHIRNRWYFFVNTIVFLLLIILALYKSISKYFWWIKWILLYIIYFYTLFTFIVKQSYFHYICEFAFCLIFFIQILINTFYLDL